MEDDEFEQSLEDDFLNDEIRGESGKKSKMSILNKKKLSKHELDELFNEL